MPHSVRKLLLDVSLSCEEIMEFTKGKSFEEFQENRMLQLAIEREFEIIGEALSRLEKIDQDNLKNKIPEFRKIIGFRNVIAHGYDIIDEAALWDFAENLVSELLAFIYPAHTFFGCSCNVPIIFKFPYLSCQPNLLAHPFYRNASILLLSQYGFHPISLIYSVLPAP